MYDVLVYCVDANRAELACISAQGPRRKNMDTIRPLSRLDIVIESVADVCDFGRVRSRISTSNGWRYYRGALLFDMITVFTCRDTQTLFQGR